MQRDTSFSGPILRFFEAKAKPGCADELAHKLETTSVAVVRGQPGNAGFFWRSAPDGGNIFVFASVWKDLDAVKDRFGDEWQSSYLPEGYADLIEECSVRHFDMSSGWHPMAA